MTSQAQVILIIYDFTNNYKTQVDNATTNIATLNTTVASLSNTVAGLHNYDDTEVRGDIAALESEVSEMGSDIDDLQAASATHITAIRLVKAGDQWAWKDMSDSVMTYQEVADRIGYPETTIYTEGIENDGKTYPISYSMEDDHIDILVIAGAKDPVIQSRNKLKKLNEFLKNIEKRYKYGGFCFRIYL